MARPPKSVMSSTDAEQGKEWETIPELGLGEADIDDIEIVSAAEMVSKAEEEKFMNEKIQVMIEESENENAAQFEYAGHNGIVQYFKRGQVQTVKRKFVHALMEAKAALIAVSFGKNPQTGNEYNNMTVRKRRTHGVTLVADKNPKGREWFSKLSASI